MFHAETTELQVARHVLKKHDI